MFVLPTLYSSYLCLRRNRTSIPIMYTIASFISSLLWYDIIKTLFTVALQLPIYALNRHFVWAEGLAPPEALTTAFTELLATNYGIHSQYFVWMTRLERALAITACSGSQNRRGLPTPPHPDYNFPNLSMTLKSKKRASSLQRKLFSYIV